MSSLSLRHSVVPRRRSRNESGDDSDSSDSVNATPASNSKRPRLNPTEEESESEGDESEENEDTQNDVDGSRESSQPSAPRPQAHLGIGPGGYKPGAIVRIKVANFVTYTSAEFHPGPKLNMVIGPNGTGKSTLVCAICLGLGWGPQVWPSTPRGCLHSWLTRNTSFQSIASRTSKGSWRIRETRLCGSQDRN
jgi:hypothetical protein